jgi:hypothetical protein
VSQQRQAITYSPNSVPAAQRNDGILSVLGEHPALTSPTNYRQGYVNTFGVQA